MFGQPSNVTEPRGVSYEPLSKLLVSPLISPKVVPHIIKPLRSLDYSSYVCQYRIGEGLGNQMGFPQIKGTMLGVPMRRIVKFLVSILGIPLILGSYQVVCLHLCVGYGEVLYSLAK